MVDRERVLGKVDELDRYLAELKALLPLTPEQYKKSLTKRACERLIQLSIECTIDISKKLVIGKKLGIPTDEVNLFEKLRNAHVFSDPMLEKLKSMRGLRNVLVHEYTDVDDNRVLEVISQRLDDFELFKREVLRGLTP